MTKAITIGLMLVLIASCVNTIGPVFVQNLSTTPLIVRAEGIKNGTDATVTIALPAKSAVLVGRDSTGNEVHLTSIDILSEQCALKASFTLDTGTEGGRIVVNEDGSVDRLDEGLPAPSAESAAPSLLCADASK